jgi:8-oxo-dGTP pyrophosphatase MutT (NUDIX family)
MQMTEFSLHILHQDLFPDREAKPDKDANQVSNFSERPTVKIILMDDSNNICLIAKTGSGFYFLPGGGIEASEDPIEALKRECLEEAGCDALVEEKIGTVVEHRDEVSERRIVSCYRGKVIGEKGTPTLASDDEGFEVIWVDKVEALATLEKQLASITTQTDNFYARKFNSARDLKILQLF